MDTVDVLIPGAIGLLLVIRPQLFFKPAEAAEHNERRARQLRIAGGVLLIVALLYTFVRLLSGT